jgi:hypothetical protein
VTQLRYAAFIFYETLLQA